MSHSQPVTLADEKYDFSSVAKTLQWPALLAGLIGLGVAFGLGMAFFGGNLTHFTRAYAISYMYFTTIALGALFFVMVQHLTGAGWSVTVRRVAECVMYTLPLMALLAIPLLVLGPNLYAWMNPDYAKHVYDHIEPNSEAMVRMMGKFGYMNQMWFSIRVGAYVLIWAGLAFTLFRRSIAQDQSGDPKITTRNERTSTIGMILFALSISLAGIDILKSVDPMWFSTIWGIYIFAGSTLGFLSLLSLSLLTLKRLGYMTKVVTVEHMHDVGKLMFAFVCFWSYIAVSQYLLIWYANLPEETFWYLKRSPYDWSTSWTYVAIFLVFGHLIFPLFGLLSRHVKRSAFGLSFFAIWILAMHWVDLYWIVTPGVLLDPTTAAEHHIRAAIEPLGLHLVVDLACMVGIGGLFSWWVFRTAASTPLVPLKDPRIKEALRFENF